MRSSAIVLAGLSALALAAPLQRREYVTDTTVEFVTVYVTEGNLPTLQQGRPNHNLDPACCDLNYPRARRTSFHNGRLRRDQGAGDYYPNPNSNSDPRASR
ncbi:hypothetical protein V491_06226 [Pseudogymnoascus sp. VKM F-3775]|nr:hypothetical protein V491_06226 [Pseudogymnoascus sp. VKM F-3775]